MGEQLGLSGLTNLGNTCFLNSCMQVLSGTDELNIILDNIKAEEINSKTDIDGILLKEWAGKQVINRGKIINSHGLKNLLWSKPCTISPQRFVKIVQSVAAKKNREMFTGYAQNDLPEFLSFILECFHNSLQQKVEVEILGKRQNTTDDLAIKCYEMIKNIYEKEYSPLLDLFYGISVSNIRNNKGKILSSKPEIYMMLDIPLPNSDTNKNISLIDCFNLYCKEEVLDGDNMWLNEKTNEKEVVNKSMLFWSLPNILIVSLKRFSNNNRKRNDLVDIPLENLDLSNYVIGYKSKSYIYDLYGVCDHSGECMGGHYTASVLKSNGKWYRFNDTEVKQISNKKVISSKAYCLFFKKKSL